MAVLRILHVVRAMDVGGVETMLMNLYRNIDRTKIQFDFMVHTKDEVFYDKEILELGGRIHRVGSFNGVNLLSYTKQWDTFLTNHKEYPIIHGHLGSSAAVYLKVANKHNRFTIAHSHNKNSKSFDIASVLFSAVSYPTRYVAKYFFSCSEAAAVDRFGKKALSKKDYVVLKNAINAKQYSFSAERREKIRKEFNIDGKFVIGHVGRFDTQKNHTFLIDIFNEIYKSDKSAVLVLVGTGLLQKDIETKIKSLGLEKNVIFTGLRSDVPDLMQAMDVFLFPSLFEGLPLVLIESQATGLKSFTSEKGVSIEAKITNLLEYISLGQSAAHWAKEIMKCNSNYQRKDTYSEICKAGYDIHNTAKWLEKFYLEKQWEAKIK